MRARVAHLRSCAAVMVIAACRFLTCASHGQLPTESSEEERKGKKKGGNAGTKEERS